MTLFASFSLRHAINVSIAVLLAYLIYAHFDAKHEIWLLLSAFLVSQTSRGPALRQGLIYFLMITIAMLASSLFMLFASHEIIAAILILLFIKTGYLIYTRPLAFNHLYFPLIFFTAFLLSALLPVTNLEFIPNRLIAIIVGSLIGILCQQFIFRVRFAREFSLGVLPILKTLAICSAQLSQAFRQYDEVNSPTTLIAEKKCELEGNLQAQLASYPEWVYAAGFNPGLRSGFRFFLINLERLTDLFSSLNYLVSEPTDAELFHVLIPAISDTMEKNQELLLILIAYFEEKKYKETTADFISDINQLENTLQEVVPINLELLDISPAYVTLTAIVRDIKDMRNLLLQLVKALPG